jgi:alpha-ribazole phosphatase
MALTLLRHTAPIAEAGICYGAMDVDVRDEEVVACATHIGTAAFNPQEIWYSPRKRCAKLAIALAARCPTAAIRSRPEIAEMNFGTWEGQRWDAVGKPAIDAWQMDFAHHKPGGGESTAALLLRVREALLDAARFRGELLWVTHGGVMRAVSWWLGGTCDDARAFSVRSSEWPQFKLNFGVSHRVPSAMLRTWRQSLSGAEK